MSISSEKLYTEPGSEEELELQQEQERVHRRSNNTGAKTGKGKKIALTILVIGGIAAAAIFGTKAIHTAQECQRVDSLISNYQVENYVAFPGQILTDRAYDITIADGKKITNRLESNGIEYININGQFYTPNGIDINLLTFEVIYTDQVDAMKITSEGQTMYMAPAGYSLNGTKATKDEVEIRTVALPANQDVSNVSFPGATSWNLADEPQLIHTLPYSVIENSTLICDVPDGASLNDNNQCYGSLDLAPKKR